MEVVKKRKEIDKKTHHPPKNNSALSRKWNDYPTFQNVFICLTNLVMNLDIYIELHSVFNKVQVS